MPRADKQREQQGTVHENRRDYACPYCPKAFGQAGTLRTHVSTVHEKRRDHACPYCPKAFGQKSDLTKHVRSQHPSNAQDDVAGHSSQPGAAARILSADYIVDALLNR